MQKRLLERRMNQINDKNIEVYEDLYNRLNELEKEKTKRNNEKVFYSLAFSLITQSALADYKQLCDPEKFSGVHASTIRILGTEAFKKDNAFYHNYILGSEVSKL